MKRYDSIEDIIIFGSFVKGRTDPRDIDLALITSKKDAEIAHSIKKDMAISDVHLEFIDGIDIYSHPLFLSLINEGYSIKKDGFLRDILKIRPMRLYSYDLKHLDKSKKTLFGLALKKSLDRMKGDKITSGAVLIPIDQASYFEDFLNVWSMKYKTKEWTVI